jgi:5-methylcytosine-specific restriction endonuclease McrA
LSAWTGRTGACQWCDVDLPEGRRRIWCTEKCRRMFERHHIWRRARIQARRAAKYTCARCAATRAEADLEVNHIHPLAGAGYGPSCSHHQVNLEVLCHACHVGITNEQRAAGLLRRPKE